MQAYRDEYGANFADGRMHNVGRVHAVTRGCGIYDWYDDDYDERAVHEAYMQLAYGIGPLEDDYSEDSMP